MDAVWGRPGWFRASRWVMLEPISSVCTAEHFGIL